MSASVTTDAYLGAWLTASEDRRAAAHAVLIGMDEPSAPAGEGKARNLSEQARIAGTSRQLLYRAIKAGTLKAFVPYPGANQRITDGELARWLGTRKGEV